MPATESDLRARILAFQIDEGTPDLSFEARLARENGWALAYARRVVTEYKRFVFLAMTAGHTVTPSEEVDQAWHLHLTYTRSYWERMCGEMLGRPLHHGPTRGGQEESAKFRALYLRTLASYRAAFGENAPADIWPTVGVRFGTDLHHVRVNTARNWVVPKGAVWRAVAVVALGLVAAFAGGCDGAVVNPFALVGTEFLWFLIPVLLAALALGLALQYRLRGAGSDPADDEPELDWADAAYLAGGRHRLTTAALARLVAAGAARVSVDGRVVEPASAWSATQLSAAEADVYHRLPVARDDGPALAALARNVDRAFRPRIDDLRGAGFLMSPARTLLCALATTLPLVAATLLLGLPRLINGMQADKPVGLLIGTLVVAAVVGLIAFARALNPISRRGRRAVRRLRRQAKADAGASGRPTPAAVGLAVAVLGTSALTAWDSEPLSALATWCPRTSSGTDGGGCGTSFGSSGGSSGCSGGGCGGGGGGGGGCGGCGG